MRSDFNPLAFLIWSTDTPYFFDSPKSVSLDFTFTTVVEGFGLGLLVFDFGFEDLLLATREPELEEEDFRGVLEEVLVRAELPLLLP